MQYRLIGGFWFWLVSLGFLIQGKSNSRPIGLKNSPSYSFSRRQHKELGQKGLEQNSTNDFTWITGDLGNLLLVTGVSPGDEEGLYPSMRFRTQKTANFSVGEHPSLS